jgi:hypothetical protein
LGAVLWTCNSPSPTASATYLCSSLSDSVLLLSLQSLKCLYALILLIMSSRSSSFNLPYFLNWPAQRRNCSIIVVWLVVLNFPCWHKSFSFTQVDNNWCCRQAASWLQWFDARCWFLPHLEFPCTLNNPLNTWVVPLLQIQKGDHWRVLSDCPPGYQRPYPQVWCWQDHAIIRWQWMLPPPWVG